MCKGARSASNKREYEAPVYACYGLCERVESTAMSVLILLLMDLLDDGFQRFCDQDAGGGGLWRIEAGRPT